MARRRGEASPLSLFSFQDIVTGVMGVMVLVLLVIALELVQRQFTSPAAGHAALRRQTALAIEQARAQLSRLQAAIQQMRARLAQEDWEELARRTTGEMQQEIEQLREQAARLQTQLAAAHRQQEQLQERARQVQEHAQARQSQEEQTLQSLAAQAAAVDAELEQLRHSGKLFLWPVASGGRTPWVVQLEEDQILVARLGPQERPGIYQQARPAARRQAFLSWANGRDRQREYFVLFIRPGAARWCHDLQNELLKRGFLVGLELLGPDQSVVDPEHGAPTLTPPERSR